jgi:hypothetical protein
MPNSLTFPNPIAVHHSCPSEDELRQLLASDADETLLQKLQEHVGECEACQQHLDELAQGDQTHLSQVIRGIDSIDPPKESAFWKVVRAEGVVDSNHEKTQAMSSLDLLSITRLKLDFLQKPDKPGRIGRLNRFDIVKVIGRGGMGVVLHAFDPSLQRDVAVKVLDPQLATNDSYLKRFCREARTAASVSHENIVAVHQVEEDENSGLPFLVMQLVTGESLEQRLKRVKKLTVQEVVRFGAQAAAGLAAAHAAGLIHRDVKPGNMLLEAGTERLKLTDFGLARANEDNRITLTGFVSGTPLYMAPEQARGDEVDHRADLFSLGVVLYEALAGRPPFEGKTPLAVLRRVSDEPHPPLGKLNPDVPAWLEDVIDRLLTKDRNKRFDSALEVAELLAAHVTLSPSLECLPEAGNGCSLSAPLSHLSRAARRRRQLKICSLFALTFFTGVILGGIGYWAAAPFFGFDPNRSNAVVVPKPEPEEEWGAGSRQSFAGNSGAVWSVATCPDGRTLAMGLEDGRILIYDMIEKRVRTTLDVHKGPVWGLEFFPDAHRFVSGSEDGTVNVWELGKSKPIKSLPHPTGVRAIALQRDGLWVATGDRSGQLQIWNLEEEAPVCIFDHGSSIHSISFASDGLSVASAGADRATKLWNIPTKEQRYALQGNKGPVYAVSLSPNPDHALMATGGWDSTIRIYESDSGRLIQELTGHEYDVWSLAFSADGKTLTSAGQDGTVRVWDMTTFKPLQSFKAHKPVAHVVRYGRDGKTIVSGGRDGYVRIWDTPARQ